MLQLKNLYNDERTKTINNRYILETMYNEMVIGKDMVDKFAQSLKDHQKSLTADNSTSVLEKAVLEHNIQVVSHIYTKISFSGLGRFLGITPKMAETLIAKMVGEKRIEAILDQAKEVIEFKGNRKSE